MVADVFRRSAMFSSKSSRSVAVGGRVGSGGVMCVVGSVASSSDQSDRRMCEDGISASGKVGEGGSG